MQCYRSLNLRPSGPTGLRGY
jgi:hypothetical protein